jgi:hypothetical protein
MNEITHTDDRGRKYKAYQDGDKVLIIGPPEDLVDELGLPEDFATRLHNILFRRGIFSYEDAAGNHNNLLGALQEAYRLDVQKLSAALFDLSQEVRHE